MDMKEEDEPAPKRRLSSTGLKIEERDIAEDATKTSNWAGRADIYRAYKKPVELDGSVPSSNQQPHSTIQSKIRFKKDMAWKYVTERQDEAGRKTLTCTFCHKIFRGGGINRMKQHFAGAKGNIASCLMVPPDVKVRMQNALEESSQKVKEKQSVGLNLRNLNEDEEIERKNTTPKTTNIEGTTSSTSDNLQSYFQQGACAHDSFPSTKSALHDADMAIAMWLYDAGIPLSAVNSPFFAIAMSKIASVGYGYTGPTFHAMRGSLLKDAKQSVKLIVDSYRKSWSETGCTIMCERWEDCRQRPLLNFLVYCPKGISFIKSVDASGVESNAESLCNLFGDMIELVGSNNVVHLVTNNATNYKAAGSLLCKRYPLICWSPCATHCINLIMKDISELPNVDKLLKLASRVTVFIYNHKWTLNWLRKRDGWTEIIRPGATRFDTSFIALKSLCDHKFDLQALVVSNEFRKVSKLAKAKEMRLVVLDENFWQKCLTTLKVMGPILRLLRICDSDEKPSLGYVYEGIDRAIKRIKKLFQEKEDLYKPYLDIIDARWDDMLRKSLHSAGYWLNPRFHYSDDASSKKKAFAGVLDMVEKNQSEDALKLLLQLGKFRDREGTFGRPLALASCKGSRADEWWKLFGGDVPELQTFAVRILSQTASSFGCERNWSVFERIHTKRRNGLEHQRLIDLVYVHYNLRLQNRLKVDKRSYDPVDYESIDKTEFWVVDEEAEPELDYDELENLLEEELPRTYGPSTSNTQPCRGKESVEGEDDDDNDEDDVLALDDDDLCTL